MGIRQEVWKLRYYIETDILLALFHTESIKKAKCVNIRAIFFYIYCLHIFSRMFLFSMLHFPFPQVEYM